MLHGSSTTWFQTLRYCRAIVEFNSIEFGTAIARRLKRAKDSPVRYSPPPPPGVTVTTPPRRSYGKIADYEKPLIIITFIAN